MFNTANVFHAVLVIPILNLLIGLYHLLILLHIPWALGFAVILLTVIIRLILNPLSATQLKSAQKLAQIKPELDKLNAKFKDDKQQLYKEQMNLYKREGINPAGGCLPLILQMPILIALYQLFFQLLNSTNMEKVIGEVNKVVYFPFLKITSLDLSFLGTTLVQKPSDWQKAGWLLLSIPLITAGLQYWQTKLMMPQTPKPANLPAVVGKDSQKPEKKEDNMAEAMQKQMGIMMPLMIGFFSYSLPLGLSLYWNTFTVFGIIQQRSIKKSSDAKEKNGQEKK